VGAGAFEAVFEVFAEEGEGPAEEEVEGGDAGVDEEGAEGGVVDDLGGAGELGEADDGCQRPPRGCCDRSQT
jgi:hypothetical protein